MQIYKYLRIKRFYFKIKFQGSRGAGKNFQQTMNYSTNLF